MVATTERKAADVTVEEILAVCQAEHMARAQVALQLELATREAAGLRRLLTDLTVLRDESCNPDQLANRF